MLLGGFGFPVPCDVEAKEMGQSKNPSKIKLCTKTGKPNMNVCLEKPEPGTNTYCHMCIRWKCLEKMQTFRESHYFLVSLVKKRSLSSERTGPKIFMA